MSDYYTYFRPFEAHGQRFRNPDEANARIKEINEEIFRIGLSDGRLTEWLVIEDALAEAWKAEKERREKAEYQSWKWEQIRNTERELDMLREQLDGKREEAAHGWFRMIDAIAPNGRRTKTHYRTETGFLKAYLRMVKADYDIIFAE
jgi:hypothetical protein